MEHNKELNTEKQCDIHVVSGSTFTNEELTTIKIDILHILDKIDLNQEETHKRNLILNKIKNILGEQYYH